jgi:transcriptional regulator with XRE-family HTH domain
VPESEDVVPGMAEAIEERRLERGLTLKAFANTAGVTPQGLVPLRKGYRRNYREKLKIGVCTALGWTADSIDLLLNGQPPVRATDYGVALAALDQMAPVTRADLERVRQELKQDLQDLQQNAVVIDLDSGDVDATPADGGTLSLTLRPGQTYEVGDRGVLLLRGTRKQFDELLRQLTGSNTEDFA